MNLDKAVERLQLLLKKKGPVWINNEDKQAFNTIIIFLNETQEENFTKNIHFDKLFAYVLGSFLEKYNATISDSIPHRELNRVLSRPFENIVEDITHKMNNRLRYAILKNAKCPLDRHPLSITPSENKNILINLKKQLSISVNRKAFLGNTWTNEEVSLGIKNQIKNFLYEIR